jgi:hypothetical protein
VGHPHLGTQGQPRRVPHGDLGLCPAWDRLPGWKGFDLQVSLPTGAAPEGGGALVRGGASY